MLGAFWQAVGGKLADRWASISGQALVFWAGGLAAWIHHRGGLTAQTNWLNRQTAAAQIGALVTGLLVLTAVSVAVANLATPVLRWVEGYWPAWANRLRQRLTTRLASDAVEDEKAWQQAYTAIVPPAEPTPEQLATFARLERKRRRRPADPAYFMPTPVGNILRAAERRPVDKYGLDTVVLWPRLWLLLPKTTRQELLAARASVDSAVTAAIWGVLFCGFTLFTPYALPAGIVVAVASIAVVLPARAQVFGDLIETAYDLHRTALYKQLRWPLPTDPAAEPAQGKLLTAYLWRGSDRATPAFTDPDT